METALVEVNKNIEILNRRPIGKGGVHVESVRPVSFLTESEVYQLADAAKTMRDGERNELLILVLFQGCLRISESLQLTPDHRKVIDGVHVVGVIGKGNKPRLVAIPEKLSYHLGDFAQRNGLGMEGKFFPIGRVRAWQMIRECAEKTGLDHKRIYPHLFRHGGAVSRLMKTGNLRSLQMLLGHADQKMTLRYLATMQMIQSLEVEGKVVFER